MQAVDIYRYPISLKLKILKMLTTIKKMLLWRKSVTKSWKSGKSKDKNKVWWPVMSEKKKYGYQVPTILQIIQVHKKSTNIFCFRCFHNFYFVQFFFKDFRFLFFKICFQISIFHICSHFRSFQIPFSEEKNPKSFENNSLISHDFTKMSDIFFTQKCLILNISIFVIF